jgi:hypothetical protein
MTIPLPALLAIIVLLLWPAARLSSVLMEPVRTAPSRRPRPTGLSPYRALVGTVTIVGHFLLLMIVLGAIYLIEVGIVGLLGEEPALFGLVPLKSLFRFIGLAQFSIFTIYAAVDTRRVLRVEVHDQESSGSEYVSGFGSVVSKVRARLVTDLPIYLSTPVLSAALLLVGIGLVGRAIVSPG